MFNPLEYKEATGGSNKMFSPGLVYARVANIALEDPTWDKKNGTFVMVTIEGPDQGEGFQGFAIDKNDPGLGNYVGPIATVRSGTFTFSDFTHNEKFIEKGAQIGQYLEDLTKQMGKLDALKEEFTRLQMASADPENFSIDTIEDYLELVKSVVIDPDNFGYFTLTGEPYTNSTGNTSYSFRFPKKDKKNGVMCYPFAQAKSEEEIPENVLVLDTYIIPKYVKPGTEAAATVATDTATPTGDSEEVAGFAGQTATLPGVASVPTASVTPEEQSELDQLPF